MIRYWLLFFTFLTLTVQLTAQIEVGLIAYYPFDGSAIDVTGNTANVGIEIGEPEYDCGIDGTAIALDGQGDGIIFPQGQVNDEFDDEDFTVSLYFKATSVGGEQYLISKIDSSCNIDRRFTITYRPDNRLITVLLSENLGKSIKAEFTANNSQCWQQIAIVRKNTTLIAYLNGEYVDELSSSSRINIINDGPLRIGTVPPGCLGPGQTSFRGLIDEVRVYQRALNRLEARDLYLNPPDHISTSDTLIFLGDAVPTSIGQTCATNFIWSPEDGVANINSPNTLIVPTRPGLKQYFLTFRDNNAVCQARDSLRITVVDPASLDCGKLFFPDAFTPNGDGLNDVFGLSNYLALDGKVQFEIFDRWGGRVFLGENPSDTWDGTFKGEMVMPGVYLYKFTYQCRDEEIVVNGSVTVIR